MLYRSQNQLLMKTNTLLVYFFFIFYSQLGNAQATSLLKPFATISGESYIFKIDTVGFKKNAKDNILPNEDVVLQKIQIIKQVSLGAKNQFYYVMVSSSDNKFKIAKWLNRKGNNLYVNDVLAEGDLFEQSYLLCIGDGTCGPQVFEDKGNRMWGCSEDLKCYTDRVKLQNCQSVKSIFGLDE